MPKRLTQSEWVGRAIAVHGDMYDYESVVYVNSSIKVEIKCRRCGTIFSQLPHAHVSLRQGCSRCNGGKRYSEAEFCQKAESVHGAGRYDYSRVKYQTGRVRVEISCNSCGLIFQQTPFDHLQGHGCSQCGREATVTSRKLTTSSFIEKAMAVHTDGEYGYKSVEYQNSTAPVAIYCNNCNSLFEQSPADHLSGKGCGTCGIERAARARSQTTEEFIEKAQAQHAKGAFDYSNVVYINSSTKVEICCNTCLRTFWQAPASHYSSGSGCPYCASSRGEKLVAATLDEWGIAYETQRWFSGCRSPIGNVLKFDFYIPKWGVVIEYQGKQHYHLVEYFNGKDGLKRLQAHDQIKRDFIAGQPHMHLIEIKYSVVNVPRHLGIRLSQSTGIAYVDITAAKKPRPITDRDGAIRDTSEFLQARLLEDGH